MAPNAEWERLRSRLDPAEGIRRSSPKRPGSGESEEVGAPGLEGDPPPGTRCAMVSGPDAAAILLLEAVESYHGNPWGRKLPAWSLRTSLVNAPYEWVQVSVTPSLERPRSCSSVECVETLPEPAAPDPESRVAVPKGSLLDCHSSRRSQSPQTPCWSG